MPGESTNSKTTFEADNVQLYGLGCYVSNNISEFIDELSTDREEATTGSSEDKGWKEFQYQPSFYTAREISKFFDDDDGDETFTFTIDNGEKSKIDNKTLKNCFPDPLEGANREKYYKKFFQLFGDLQNIKPELKAVLDYYIDHCNMKGFLFVMPELFKDNETVFYANGFRNEKINTIVNSLDATLVLDCTVTIQKIMRLDKVSFYQDNQSQSSVAQVDYQLALKFHEGKVALTLNKFNCNILTKDLNSLENAQNFFENFQNKYNKNENLIEVNMFDDGGDTTSSSISSSPDDSFSLKQSTCPNFSKNELGNLGLKRRANSLNDLNKREFFEDKGRSNESSGYNSPNQENEPKPKNLAESKTKSERYLDEVWQKRLIGIGIFVGIAAAICVAAVVTVATGLPILPVLVPCIIGGLGAGASLAYLGTLKPLPAEKEQAVSKTSASTYSNITTEASKNPPSLTTPSLTTPSLTTPLPPLSEGEPALSAEKPPFKGFLRKEVPEVKKGDLGQLGQEYLDTVSIPSPQ